MRRFVCVYVYLCICVYVCMFLSCRVYLSGCGVCLFDCCFDVKYVCVLCCIDMYVVCALCALRVG